MLLRTRPATVRRSPLQALADRATPAHLALGRTGAGTVMVLRPRAVFGPGDTVLLPRVVAAARAGP